MSSEGHREATVRAAIRRFNRCQLRPAPVNGDRPPASDRFEVDEILILDGHVLAAGELQRGSRGEGLQVRPLVLSWDFASGGELDGIEAYATVAAATAAAYPGR